MSTFPHAVSNATSHAVSSLPLSLHEQEQGRDFGIVILQCARRSEHVALAQICYKSVRAAYPDAPIMLIDDASTMPSTFRGEGDPLVTFIASEFPGAGELLPYYYLHKLRPFRQALILHDSMYLRAALPPIPQPILFLWTFRSYIWNDRANYRPIVEALPKNTAKALACYDDIRTWMGCFGSASIIQLDTLDALESHFGFLSLVRIIKTRTDRMALERLLGVLCFSLKLFSEQGGISLSGDIGAHAYYNTNRLREMIVSPYKSYVLKTWHSR